MQKLWLITFLLLPIILLAQNASVKVEVKGLVKDETTGKTLTSVHVVNVNAVKGTITDDKGNFEIVAEVNDTLHFSYIGYQSLRVRVTNDWVKNKIAEIKLTSKAVALEEVVVSRYNLTGYLQIDAVNIPVAENYRYDIQGLKYGYEAGQTSPNAINKTLGSIFNPADALYNLFGKKPRELKKLKDAKKDDSVRLLLESKFDRETIAVLLGIDKNEIPEILQRCNYSETFIQTANDLQILDAISDCYEEYRVLKKRSS